MRSSSGPYLSQRPVSRHSSAGCTDGISSSSAPIAFISSRTIASTLRTTRRPIGIHVKIPDVSRRIMPVRSISLWLTISASEGSSLSVFRFSALTFMRDRGVGR